MGWRGNDWAKKYIRGLKNHFITQIRNHKPKQQKTQNTKVTQNSYETIRRPIKSPVKSTRLSWNEDNSKYINAINQNLGRQQFEQATNIRIESSLPLDFTNQPKPIPTIITISLDTLQRIYLDLPIILIETRTINTEINHS